MWAVHSWAETGASREQQNDSKSIGGPGDSGDALGKLLYVHTS